MNLKIILLSFLLVITSLCAEDITYENKVKAVSAVVFAYHRFGESKYPSTNISLEQFEYHLDYLKKYNYNVWPLSKIVKYLKEKKPFPPKTVALTIDDAYLSIYTEAYSRFKKKKYPFTVFVNTNVVDDKGKDFMSWDQMREMQKHGAEFANHSFGHGNLIQNKNETKEQWRERVTNEVKKAEKRLIDELGSKNYFKMLAYPYGEYSMDTASLIQELGYVGVTQTSGAIGINSDLKELSRFAMNDVYAKSFLTKLHTSYMPIDSVLPKKHIVAKVNPPILKIKLKNPLKDMRCYLSSGELLELEWVSDTEAKVYSTKTLKPPRDRYTCTARANKNSYYWYSHLWIIE